MILTRGEDGSWNCNEDCAGVGNGDGHGRWQVVPRNKRAELHEQAKAAYESGLGFMPTVSGRGILHILWDRAPRKEDFPCQNVGIPR